jgi:putative NADPH-quinone reductase
MEIINSSLHIRFHHLDSMKKGTSGSKSFCGDGSTLFPMQILVVLAHPDDTSFNHAIAKIVCETLDANKHQVKFIDLYKEGFDPLLPASEFSKDAILDRTIEQHCLILSEADGIVIVHPNWWGMPPAILTGWIDRVFRPGRAYRFVEGDSGEGAPEGLLKAGAAVVLNTSNTKEAREGEVFGDPLERIWKDCVFGLCGVHRVYRKMFRVIVTSTCEQRVAWLEETRGIIHEYFPAG